MIGPVEGRPQQVVHARIQDDETLPLAFLDKDHAADQRGALGHERAARLDMDPLVRAMPQMLRQGLEPKPELRDGMAVRIVIIHAQTAAQVDVVDLQPLALEMGNVYQRLILDTMSSKENYVDGIIRVYNDELCDVIDNYNCSAFYEPSYVIARAYQAGGF